MTTTQTPREIDTRLAALYEDAAKTQQRHDMQASTIHSLAGDKREWVGRSHLWKRTFAEVMRDVEFIAKGDGYQATQAIRAIKSWDETQVRLDEIQVEMAELDAVYQASPWTRYFPCTNRDGHIHSSLHCHTLRYDTPMAWTPQISGRPVADAVAELGEALCTHCFADAPADWKAKTLGQVKDERTRTEREAAKAAKDAIKWAKTLRREEEFRCDRSWVTTVAACKQLLRDEVMFRDYFGHGEHPSHAEHVKGAEQATRVLLARGVEQAEIDKVIASAVKKNRKDGARI